MIRNWLRSTLGVDELENRVCDLEGRIDNLEVEIKRGLRQFGSYKNRSKDELKLMRKQVSDLLETVEALVSHNENNESLERALALRKRLRNNYTRINRYINESVT